MTKRHKRFKLLFDEMFPRKEKFPQLNNHHDIKHIVHDLKKSGSTDLEVVKISNKLGRIVITKNIKDFIKLGKKYEVDIYGVEETITPEKLDNKLMASLKRRKARKMKGRFTKISN